MSQLIFLLNRRKETVIHYLQKYGVPVEKVVMDMKEGLHAFYREVDKKQNPTFLKAIKTFKNWQTEI